MNKSVLSERSIPREYYGGGGGLPSVRICLAEEAFTTRAIGDPGDVTFDYPSDYFNQSQRPARNFQRATR